MYQANLSYKLLCRYLGEVLDAGLVKFENEDCYDITPKGREFLSRHEEYFKRCKSLQDQVSEVNNEKTVLEKMCFNQGRGGNNPKSPSRSKRSGR